MTYDPEVEMYIRKELKLPTELLQKVYDEWKKNPPTMIQEQQPEGSNDNFNKGDAKDNDIQSKEEPKKKQIKKVTQIPEGG